MFDDTIIAYSHDNGGVPYAGALNYPLRGGKATAYEGGSRSPGFVHAPKLLPRSRNHQGLFHVSDFFPTLVSMVSEMSGMEHWYHDFINNYFVLRREAKYLSGGS